MDEITKGGNRMAVMTKKGVTKRKKKIIVRGGKSKKAKKY